MLSLDAALSCLIDLLEISLQAKNARREPWIVAGPATEREAADGSLSDCVFAAVVSIVGDNALGRFEASRGDVSGVSVDRSPPLSVDLTVAFVADFQRKNYAVGLAALSDIISIMQDYPVIEGVASSPDAKAMGRLPVEMVNIDLGQSSHVASMLGLSGQPFVLYRVRRLPFRGGSFRAVSAPITGVGGFGPVPRG